MPSITTRRSLVLDHDEAATVRRAVAHALAMLTTEGCYVAASVPAQVERVYSLAGVFASVGIPGEPPTPESPRLLDDAVPTVVAALREYAEHATGYGDDLTSGATFGDPEEVAGAWWVRDAEAAAALAGRLSEACGL